MSGTIRLVLDRFEEDMGVFEGMGNVPRALLPMGLQEGDTLVVTLGVSEVGWKVEPNAKAREKAAMEALRASLLEAAVPDSGDFEL